MELALAVRDLVLAVEGYRIRLARETLGVGATEMIALGTVLVEGPRTPSQLARKLGITTASATELLDRLEGAGLVKRGPHPTDRRKLLISLTPRAEQAVADIYRQLDGVLSAATDLDSAARVAVTAFLRDAATALGQPQEA